MKRIAIFGFSSLFIVVVLAAVGIALAPRFVDLNQYKDQAAEKIKAAIGYDVVFGGDVSLGLLPMPHATLSDVMIKNPAGFSGPYLAKLGSLDVQVALAPLFSGRVEVATVELKEPQIFLEQDAQGKTNWSVEKEGAGTSIASEVPHDDASEKSADVVLDGIKISGGLLSYKNANADPVVIQDINLDVDAQTLQGPFDIAGRLTGFEQTLNFRMKIKDVQSLDVPLSVTASGSIDPANLSFQYAGIIDVLKQAAQGQMDVKFEAGEGKAMVNATAKEIILTEMVVAATGHRVTGAMSTQLNPLSFKGAVDVDGADLDISGTFKDNLDIRVDAGIIDLDRLLGQKTSSSEALNQPLGLPPSDSGASGSSKSGGFNLPVIFDLKIAKALYQGQTLEKIVAQGAFQGQSLGLKNLSVASVAGTSLKAKGSIADIQALRGIDGTVSGSVSDIQAFTAFTKLDVGESLPPAIKSLDFAVQAVGDARKGALNMSVTLRALDGSLTAKGDIKDAVKAPSFNNLVLSLHHPNFAHLLKAVAPDAPRYKSFSQKLTLDTVMSMQDKAIHLREIKGTLGKTSMNGALAMITGGSKPDVRGSLTFGDLALQSLGSAPVGGSEKPSGPSGGASKQGKWSSAPIQSAWLNTMDADLDIKAQSLLYESWDIKNPSIKFVMKGGTLDIQDLKADLYGGSLALASVIKPAQAGGVGMNVSTNAQFNNVDLEKLAGSLIGTKIIQTQGQASLTAQVRGQGVSQAALVSSLVGQGSLSGEKIILEGFDVARFARSMSVDNKPGDTVMGLWKTSTKGGSTQFDTLQGQYSIAQGIVTLKSLALDGPTAAIQSKGTVNLPKWSLDTNHSITAKGEDIPPFTVDISGPLDNPGQTFAQGAIQNYLQQKLSRKLNKVLGDKLDLGGGDGSIEQQLFDKFLGDGGSVNDNTQSGTGTQKVEPAGGEAPSQKNVTPEDAVKDLIQGLF